jgi:glycosyltransferase involved in cell wall biosynthesis
MTLTSRSAHPINRPSIGVLYVSDSTTVSGAEHVMLAHLEQFCAPTFRTHVFFRASNVRLRRELDARGISYTSSDSFSSRVIRSTLKPDHLWTYARALHRVRNEISALAASEQIDVIHSIGYPAALYAALAARTGGLPHIWHEHGIKRIHRVNRWIYQWVADTCRYVIGPSDAVTAALGQAGLRPPRLQTVYNGIDLTRFDREETQVQRVRHEFALRDGDPAVALVGQLLPHKGHRLLIDAAPAVLRVHPKARFFIVGALENPPYEAELRKAVQDRGLEQRFVFTGWRSDIHVVVSAMDASIVATVTPEPAALSLMEAMAVGCPVVASRTGGTAELVLDGETGLLFEPGNAVQLAARIVELLNDSSLRHRLSVAGRQRMVEHFGLKRHVDEIAGLYRRCDG